MISGIVLTKILDQISGYGRTANKIVAYSVILGGFDQIAKPKIADPLTDYFLLTDQSGPVPHPWRAVMLPKNLDTPRLVNRFLKFHPHLIFPQYEYSLYIDGSIILSCAPSILVREYLGTRASFCLAKHPWRSCAYEEAERCKKRNKAPGEIVDKQMERYRAEGFPVNFGLTENGFLLRRHGESTVKDIMADWWREVSTESIRDQLSLPYVLWRGGYKVALFPERCSSRDLRDKRDDILYYVQEHKASFNEILTSFFDMMARKIKRRIASLFERIR